ncbi:MAG: glycerol-3-phosphate acyltransferase [Chloroflexi bacterium]|nr:glycerol-3-phosphate acyltransferase [Chloroflexota bacterium]
MTTPVFCPLLILASYLLGSVSSAILVTRLWTGKDIRTLGNRNAGAANVARSVGLLPAAVVSVVDFSKGALPVFAAHRLGLGDACALGGAVAAVIGHSYPVYFRFRGGKGLAVSIGALLVFTPFETLLVLPVLGLVYLVITGSAVTGALVSLSLLIGLNLWRGHPLIVALSPLVLLVTMGLCTIPQALFDWRERADKKRLLAYWLSPKDEAAKRERVAVITDSVASLPPEWRTREKIHVVPMALILPEGVYHDGVDIDPRQYYRRLRQDGLPPKTSAPSPGEFLAVYQRLAKTYYSGVVITPPQELTQVWESARLAAETATGSFLVEVVDSRTAGPAQGFVALAAARAIASGADLQTILEVIQKVQKKVGFVGLLDTVKFLIEGGRAAHLNRWLKSALRLYPILYIHEGQIRLIGMARTKAKAVERMIAWLSEKLPGEGISLAIAHTDAFEEAAMLEKRLLGSFHPDEHFVTELTPVIGAHAGPGLLGVAWWVHPLAEQENTHGREET